MNKWLSLSLSSLLAIPTVFAIGLAQAFEPLEEIIIALVQIGSFGWLDQNQGEAVKFLLFIVLLVLINEILKKPFAEAKRVRGVIAFAVSAISIIFLPADFELIIGTQYGALFAFLAINLVNGFGLYIFWKLINKLNDERWKNTWLFVWWLMGFSIFSGTAAMVGLSLDRPENGVAEALSYFLIIFPLGIAWSAIALITSMFSGKQAFGGPGILSGAIDKITSWNQNRGGGPEARKTKRKQKSFNRKENTLEKFIKRIEKREIKTLKDIILKIKGMQNIIAEKKDLKEKEKQMLEQKTTIWNLYKTLEKQFISTVTAFEAKKDNFEKAIQDLEESSSEENQKLEEYNDAFRLLGAIKDEVKEFRTEIAKIFDNPTMDMSLNSAELEELRKTTEKIKAAIANFIDKDTRLTVSSASDANGKFEVEYKIAKAKNDMQSHLDEVKRKTDELYGDEEKTEVFLGSIEKTIEHMVNAQNVSFSEEILKDNQEEIEDLKEILSEIKKATNVGENVNIVALTGNDDIAGKLNRSLKKVYDAYAKKVEEFKELGTNSEPHQEYDYLENQREAIIEFEAILNTIVKDGQYNHNNLEKLKEKAKLVEDVTKELIAELQQHYKKEDKKVELKKLRTNLRRRISNLEKDIPKMETVQKEILGIITTEAQKYKRFKDEKLNEFMEELKQMEEAAEIEIDEEIKQIKALIPELRNAISNNIGITKAKQLSTKITTALQKKRAVNKLLKEIHEHVKSGKYRTKK